MPRISKNTKNTLFFAAVIYILLAAVPFTALIAKPGKPSDENRSPESLPEKALKGGFYVREHETGTVKFFSDSDYVFGVVASEMDINAPDEALKAQAVASYTFALNRKIKNRQNGSFGDENPDISDDPSVDQCFITRDTARQRWGDKAAEYEKRLDSLIKSVEGKAVTYNGEVANTVYHSISPGKTLSSEEVWGNAVPYLVEVESVGDLLADGYLSREEIPAADFEQKMISAGAESMSEDKAAYISSPVYGKSGSVLTLTVGNKEFSGSDIRKIFSLRSCAFDVSFNGDSDSFVFTVRGYGHGVGMSQNGAIAAANQGSKYDEILKWYYPGCEVSSGY